MAQPVELSEVIGGYVLERVLGRGGMGTVFLGKHRLLGRAAAVKVLDIELADNEQLVSRFFHEAKIVNDVRHPNIVDVIDFVRTEKPPRVAFIMEYLDGEPLDRFLKEVGPLPVTAAINVVLQILDGLSAVHAIGVIHRDLKPANLRFTSKVIGDASAVPIIKILDFGIAKASGPMVTHKTQTGLVMGTPSYMAPEQVAGEPVSTASDVYAVGEILYELLGGRRLFNGTNTEVLRAKLAPDPPRIELPPLPCQSELTHLIRACVAFEGPRRPKTEQMIDELRQIRSRAFGAVPTGFEDIPKQTTLIPVPSPLTPAPPPAAMNTLGADKSLYAAPPVRRQRGIMPLAASVAFLAAGALTAFLLSQREAPIVVNMIPEPIQLPDEPSPPPPPAPPPPVAIVEPEPPPPPEPRSPIKKKTKKVAVRPPPPPVVPTPPPPAENAFGKIKVTAWTTAGRQVPAMVKIDGRAVGRSAPLEIKARAGKRKVEVEAVGHPPKTQEVLVKDGETTALDVVVDLR